MAMEDPQEPLTGVGKTALGMALVRAEESRRSDRLFNDPYAEAFLAAVPDAFGEEQEVSPEQASLAAVFFFHGVVRTRFFDDYLMEASAHGCHQVVLLAAGLDTRSFRLAWPPGVRSFELDRPDVLEVKDRVLSKEGAVPRCSERIVLAVDLRDDWTPRLMEAGFQPTTSTAWLLEGLMAYLSAREAAHLLSTVGELSAPGSQLAFEDGSGADASLLGGARQLPDMNEFTSLWKGGLGEDAPKWLAKHGWRTTVHERVALAASYGRPVPTGAAGRFLTAVRGTPDRDLGFEGRGLLRDDGPEDRLE
ncbi:MAG: SAM-dependent methyltransferase, partial [Acidimicrobiales bacterium]